MTTSRALPLIAGLLLALLTCASARADVISDGYRGIRHRCVVVDGPLIREHRIVAFPTAGFGTAVELEPGVPFRFSGKYGTRLYAVPEGEDVGDWRFGETDLGAFPSCDMPVGHVREVHVASPVTAILSSIELTAVGADSLAFRVVDEVRETVAGVREERLHLYLGLGAVALLGLVVLVRARGRAAR